MKDSLDSTVRFYKLFESTCRTFQTLLRSSNGLAVEEFIDHKLVPDTHVYGNSPRSARNAQTRTEKSDFTIPMKARRERLQQSTSAY